MNTLKQKIENILIELELSIKQLIARQNNKTEQELQLNTHVLEHLKDLEHILNIAKKIINKILIDNLDPKV